MLAQRIIGIRHRVKTAGPDGEPRPTTVAILTMDATKILTLESKDDELDFVLARFPVEFRAPEPDEDLSKFLPRHLKWRKLKEGDDLTARPENQIMKDGRLTYVLTKVPSAYDGLSTTDVVAMSLGGSGDRFAFALTNRGLKIGATVHRVPPYVLKQARGNWGSKDDDHILLGMLFVSTHEAFYQQTARDLDYIRMREMYRARREALLGRMACAQRLLQRTEGDIFLSEAGQYPEGNIEDIFDAAKANDVILTNLIKEESKRESDLAKAVKKVDVWDAIFKDLEGCGPVLAAGLMTAIGDIRRFRGASTRKSEAKLKAYLGVHVMKHGKYEDTPEDKAFPRQRQGVIANWEGQGRQALYLLADQWNKRPDSVWGLKLREHKARLRAKHPMPIQIENAKGKLVWFYTDGHIHKMAIWRTATRFVEWLYREWSGLENRAAKKPLPDMSAPESAAA